MTYIYIRLLWENPHRENVQHNRGNVQHDKGKSRCDAGKTPTSAIGNRTLVLHEMRDDGGTGGFPDSNSTGYSFHISFIFRRFSSFFSLAMRVQGLLVVSSNNQQNNK